MTIIGLVGNPASGKSTVASYLESLGAIWINADKIARSTLHRDSVRPQLIAEFGDQIIVNDEINRDALASLVFGDTPSKQAALKRLEAIVHPPTHHEIQRQLNQARKKTTGLIVLDIPLLFESEWNKACDTIWCIDANRERREQWAAKRGWDSAELLRREASQISIAEKKDRSNHVLENNDSIEKLQEQIHLLLDR